MPRVPNLRAVRDRALLSQIELSLRSGVGQATISKAERGQPLRGSTIRKLAAALDVPPTELLATPSYGGLSAERVV
jgi:transcriptional regulator with XRE-family HTH domain